MKRSALETELRLSSWESFAAKKVIWRNSKIHMEIKKKINRKAQREKKFYKSKCSEDKTQDQLRRKFCLKKECVVSAERLKITEENEYLKLKKEIEENRRKFKKWYKFKKFRKINDKWRNLKEEIWK
ncbi:unnamed protein product [Blepharisma stoltei]|uniref:Uncharacterized protein n=1 Tax=Blepharisma stoltei TaxID=1481888 RepID=A0AAU9KH84_9CILI|nr:unnamed protein product [Blepharisma stoltei]